MSSTAFSSNSAVKLFEDSLECYRALRDTIRIMEENGRRISEDVLKDAARVWHEPVQGLLTYNEAASWTEENGTYILDSNEHRNFIPFKYVVNEKIWELERRHSTWELDDNYKRRGIICGTLSIWISVLSFLVSVASVLVACLTQ